MLIEFNNSMGAQEDSRIRQKTAVAVLRGGKGGPASKARAASLLADHRQPGDAEKRCRAKRRTGAEPENQHDPGLIAD